MCRYEYFDQRRIISAIEKGTKCDTFQGDFYAAKWKAIVFALSSI